ncbi:hypothetical protein [Bradyrhizobium sp. CCBAU 45384]|uniref:hypothetical protein n=1 Tax=Bradyrhizobium sp. CCBAU 45384 TaxID=858428 RepID=UPI0023069451|nr:hypothetical protein [Bradyrhizobium sp. CCBAU 45384]MDA9408857.1 hypothetical protein [Bradyrhizobium sp. CCBAU 45384]
MIDVTRHTVLIGAAAGFGEIDATGPAQAAPPLGGMEPLNSTDGVFTPSKGWGIQKFSFSNPEPSIQFAGLLFAFEVISFENNFGIDPLAVTIERRIDRVRMAGTRLRWAGGQETKAGLVSAELRLTAAGAIEWAVEAAIDAPIKAIKTIVRGLPRGRISLAAEAWCDFGDDEQVFEYPALGGGMATPLAVVEGHDKRFWGISALQTEVRPARFAFLPGPDGYKTELVYEPGAWERPQAATTCKWRIVAAPDFASVAKTHFDWVAKSWQLPDFQQRSDAPDWMKKLALVLSLHGQHWTGYVHNDFDQQLEILRWTAKQIDPRNVMVFLNGWDGRYYWDYPRFEVGARTGGEVAFARLVRKAKTLGYRIAVMFGSNVARRNDPGFPKIADARLRDGNGDFFPANYVDWDGDRKGDGFMVFMNLAVASWRNHLRERIASIVSRFAIDAYFLDICGLWENNYDGDMLVGTRQLVDELAQRFPGVAPIAEMQYDAQMGFIPMSHVPRYSLYPQANFGVVASFNHLSFPAPGGGSTGIHEYGFGRYHPVILDQPQIPTITFVDDTFTTQREAVMSDIATAKQRFAARGGRT